MTIENDFLPFAVGSSANVLSQSAYAALTSLLQNGFQSGIANSQQLNKVWRQSSIMAAVLAQFIVSETGQTAIDDGTTATLLANLQAAIAAASRAQIILADTGAANAYTAANPAPLTALPTASGLIQRVSIAHANTGASTYAPDGLTAKPIYGLNLSALQGGELIAQGIATMLYVVASSVNSGNGAWVLLECTGGALQIAPATASEHAVQLGQVGNRAGEVCHFATISPPTGFLAADGSAISRTVYAALFAAVTIAATGSVTSGSASVTGVVNASSNWIGMPISGAGIPASTTVLNVVGTTVTLSANATATNAADAFVIAPFGVGDGSTTFNVPDLRGAFPRGWDNGRGLDSGRAFGSYQADSFASHTHTASSVSSSTGQTQYQVWDQHSGTSTMTGSGSSGIAYQPLTVTTTTTTTVNAIGGAETRGKNVALLACIKY